MQGGPPTDFRDLLVPRLRPQSRTWSEPELEDLMRRPVWMARAACRGKETSLFFPGRGLEGRVATREAKAICGGCPVREECLAFALAAMPFPDGIWGSETERARRLMRRKAA